MTEQAHRPNGERYSFETLAIAAPDQLEQVMRRGTAPQLDQLVGWEFKGFNTPAFTRLAGIRKFKKAFYRFEQGADGATPLATVGGFNVAIRQNHSLTLPWLDVTGRAGQPVRLGWFEVCAVDLGSDDNRYPEALLLDYSRGRHNPPVDPSRLLRDYLVQVYPDNPDLLLGRATAAIGFFRLPVGYFVLGRHNPLPAGPLT